MIVVDRTRWLSYVLAVRGTAVRVIWLRLLVVTLLASVVTLLDARYGPMGHGLTTLPFSLVAVALGVLLGFRNNASYDRFWEGRKLWGLLVNRSRSFARQVQTLVGTGGSTDPEGDAAVRREMIAATIAYVHLLRMHLRREGDPDEVAGWLPPALLSRVREAPNAPMEVLAWLGERLRAAWHDGRVDPLHVPALDASLTDFADIQGGCERILNTPVPFTYAVSIHRIVAVYVVTLPFGVVGTVAEWTPLVVAFLAYAFFSLDAVGGELEDPFGSDPNDLPLSALCRTIERDLRFRLGERDLPPPLEPVDRLLT